MTLKELFGANMRQYRKVRGLTQAQLAEAAELSVEMIGKIERGSAAPSFETIQTVMGVLDVSAAVLFGAQDNADLTGERGEILQQIHQHLSALNDADLETAEGMLKAFVR